MMNNKEKESALSIDDLNKVTGGEDDGGPNGFNCPICNGFIPVSVKDLFIGVAVVCPSCKLQVTIDDLKNDSGV